MSPAAATSSNLRTLNFGQSVLATANTVWRSPAAWGAVGSFAWACVASPVTAPLHFVAGVIGVTSEMQEGLAKKGIAYKSIPTRMNEAFAPVGNLLNNIPADSVPGKIKKTLSDAWQSPALTAIVGAGVFSANAFEAALRGDVPRTVISLFYVAGEGASVNLIESGLKLHSHENPEGVFAGVKSWHAEHMPERVKTVVKNTTSWFSTGNVGATLLQGPEKLINVFGIAGLAITAGASVVALSPLVLGTPKQKSSHDFGSGDQQPLVVKAVVGFAKKVFGSQAGFAQRLGAFGDELAAINSASIGNFSNALAFCAWGIQKWMFGGLSNKAAAEAAAANQAQQAR
jgi:hypothetical protein